jgi:PAS domain S-box-containing protein
VVCLAVRDITSRKAGEQLQLQAKETMAKANQSLKRANLLHEQYLRTTATAMFTVNTDMQITDSNAAMSDLTGFSREELLGRHCFVLEGEPCLKQCGLFNPARTEAIFKRKCSIKTKDGRRLIILKNADFLRDEKGTVLGGIESFVDVTELTRQAEDLRVAHDASLSMVKDLERANNEAEIANRELEVTNKQLQEKVEEVRTLAKEAEDANQAKSEFLANMSHELRTPLHGILSFSEFGIRRHETASPEKHLEYFQMIRQSGQTLLELLNDLLDLAKMEARKMQFEFKAEHLGKIVMWVSDEFQSQVFERNLVIRCEVDADDSPVMMDANRIKQVIRNLLSNAVKFSPKGGVIQLRVLKGEGRMRVIIQDEGPGIPEDELEVVFDKFVQSSKTKSGAGGTGLGLSICREIMTAHGGRIWASNNPEGGTSLAFEIPTGPISESGNAFVSAKDFDVRR